MDAHSPLNVDEYIAGFPEETQILLNQLRNLICATAPDAQEGIGYQMPAYKLHGPLVYFAGYKKHIGLYPTGSSLLAFQEALVPYRTSKGTLQFPLDKPLPLELIREIVLYRIQENVENARNKPPKKAR